MLDGADATFEVAQIATYQPWRLGRPRLSCCAVLEARAGAFVRWGLTTGDQVELLRSHAGEGT